MEEELQKAVLQTLEYARDTNAKIDKIRRYFLWQQIFNVIKFVVIVVPIVIGAIYFIPMAKSVMSQYQSVINQVNGLNGPAADQMLKNLLK